MLNKLKEKMRENDLLIYEVCVLVGSGVAFLIGLVISEQADKYDMLLEELDDPPEEG